MSQIIRFVLALCVVAVLLPARTAADTNDIDRCNDEANIAPAARVTACTAALGDTSQHSFPTDWFFYMRARAYQSLGQYDAALTDVRQALALAERDRADGDAAGNAALRLAADHLTKAQIFVAQGVPADSESDLEDLVALAPDYGHFTRGQLYLKLKRWNDAIDDETAVLTNTAFASSAYRYRGIAYREQHEYAKALQDFSAALDAYGGSAGAKDIDISRGIAYYQMGNSEAAIISYRQALAIDPSLSATWDVSQTGYNPNDPKNAHASPPAIVGTWTWANSGATGTEGQTVTLAADGTASVEGQRAGHWESEGGGVYDVTLRQNNAAPSVTQWRLRQDRKTFAISGSGYDAARGIYAYRASSGGSPSQTPTTPAQTSASMASASSSSRTPNESGAQGGGSGTVPGRRRAPSAAAMQAALAAMQQTRTVQAAAVRRAQHKPSGSSQRPQQPLHWYYFRDNGGWAGTNLEQVGFVSGVFQGNASWCARNLQAWFQSIPDPAFHNGTNDPVTLFAHDQIACPQFDSEASAQADRQANLSIGAARRIDTGFVPAGTQNQTSHWYYYRDNNTPDGGLDEGFVSGVFRGDASACARNFQAFLQSIPDPSWRVMTMGDDGEQINCPQFDSEASAQADRQAHLAIRVQPEHDTGFVPPSTQNPTSAAQAHGDRGLHVDNSYNRSRCIRLGGDSTAGVMLENTCPGTVLEVQWCSVDDPDLPGYQCNQHPTNLPGALPQTLVGQATWTISGGTSQPSSISPGHNIVWFACENSDHLTTPYLISVHPPGGDCLRP
jgi:tetratricopeptide (TPR) repeat protein